MPAALSAGLATLALIASIPALGQTAQPVITTVAGNGGGGLSGVGNPAVNTEIDHPVGLVVDAYGNLLIGSYPRHVIWKVNPSGIATIVAGKFGEPHFAGDGGLATAAHLHNPYHLSTDAAGNIYVGDYLNHRVRKITPDGNIQTIAGSGTDRDGNHLLIGGFSGDGGSPTSARFNGVLVARQDSAGNFYVVDYLNHRIRKIDVTANTVTTIAGSGESGPTAGGYAGDGQAATAARLNRPHDVAIDRLGNVYIADYSNNRIRKVTFPGGTITTVAGTGAPGSAGDDGPANAAQINGPTGLALDAAGNLYIAEYSGHRIRKVTPNGTISTVAGTGTAGFSGDNGDPKQASFQNPIAVTLDEHGNLYVADFSNNRVRKISNLAAVPPALRISRIGGFEVPIYTAGSPTSADLRLPAGTDPNNVAIEVTGVGVPEGASVQLLKNNEPVGTAALTGGKAAFTSSIPLGTIAVFQARTTVVLTASLRNALPKVDGLKLEEMELTASMGGPSSVRYLTKEGKGYTLAELQNLAKEKKAAEKRS